ncbi:hypothetical protein [Lichenibacterium ramalinae]|nr:hypothetical protein [Lichenibacterium ramalinae]
MDMKLAPDWTSTLGQAGHDAVHRSRVGPPLVRVLRGTEADLSSHALVTVDDDRVRLRLPNFDTKR